VLVHLSLTLAAALGQTGGEGEEAPEAAAPSLETVVTSTRTPRPLRDVTSTVTVLPREELERSPGVRVDDILRVVPSFATFRRTSSVAADPTAQGVNLRNVGPSAVSRALVLLDGIPVNDPFGGWVYWRSVPRLSLDRVELSPGGSSALFGSAALGGVVQLVTRPLQERTFDVDARWGSRRSVEVAARAAQRWGAFAASVEGEHFSTAGYPVVPAELQGTVDGPAPSEHQSLHARAELAAAPSLDVFARGSYFDERQNGGTALTAARVRMGGGAIGARYRPADLGEISARLWLQGQLFQQDRARIAADRSAESLAAHQDVPSTTVGLSVGWEPRPLEALGRHLALVGVDLLSVSGAAREDLVPFAPSPAALVQRTSSGTQQSLGVFAQDSFQPSPSAEILAALRFDLWRNVAGERRLERSDGTSGVTAFQDRSAWQISPRLGLRFRPLPWLTLRTSAYQAFRAPTLNELYRPFQVGTVLTASNPDLGPERLTGAEAGVELAEGPGTLRLTGFWNSLRDPIVNVTLPAPVDGAQRQRQNLGEVRILGAEVLGDLRVWRSLSLSAGYTFAPTWVVVAPAEALRDRQLPHAPAHRATLSLAWDDPRIASVALVVRHVGRQYEDDQNLLPLADATLLDVQVRREIFGGLEAYLTVNNALDARYLVGRAGVDTVGEPRTVLAGLRYRSSAR
jgi:outer membrane receptor protein involved in Fe transport